MTEQVHLPASPGNEAWTFYRYLADNALDVVLEAGTDTVVHWVSPSVEDVLGWRADEVIGRSAAELVHPDDLGEVIHLAGEINEGRRIQTRRCRMRMASGQWLPMQLRGRAAVDNRGTVVGHVITLQDTSERDAAVRALATLTAGTRAIARASDPDGLLQSVCEALVEAGGYPLAWYAARVFDEARSVRARAAAGQAKDYAEHAPVSWGDDPLGQGPTGTALRTGTTQIRHDYTDDAAMAPWMDAARSAGLRSSISLPITLDGTVHGALVTYANEAHAFDSAAQELLEDLAAEVGLGLERIEANRQLRVQRERLRGVFDSYFDPFVLLEAVRDDSGALVDLRYVEASDAACEHNGLTREEMIGSTIIELFPGQRDDGTLAGYFHTIETGEPVILDDYRYFHEPRQEWCRYDIRAVKSGDAVALTFRDVTARHEDRVALERSESRYRLLAENASDIICQVTPEGLVTWISDSVEAALGWRPDELIGEQVPIVHPDDVAGAVEALRGATRGLTVDGELRLQRRDGAWRWVHFSINQASMDDQFVLVIAIRDIDEEIRTRAALDHATGHDPLTGLPARTAMVARIDTALSQLPDGRHVVAVLNVGIDSLSTINDAFTHAAGDLVITTIATRVIRVVESAESVGRGTGSEFLVIVPNLRTGAEAADVAERIRVAAREPIAIGLHTVQPTVSIGIAIGDRRATSDQLVREAGMAMGHAKTAGRDRYAFSDRRLAEQATRRLEIEAEIRDALARDAFVPYLQPIVDLPAGDPTGYEALVRMLREDGSVAGPDAFLPVAERTPLIGDIDMAMLRKCLGLLAQFPAGQSISVNVSTATLAHPEYADQVAALLAESPADPRRLHLEVTETALLGADSRIRTAMQRIADLGVRWYVDDFGTGYSSISHLRDLPVAGLKLDLSFTAGIRDHDLTSTRLAQALAGLANGLHLDTVAEGIENDSEADVLAAQGWRHGQGWLFGRPAPFGGAADVG